MDPKCEKRTSKTTLSSQLNHLKGKNYHDAYKNNGQWLTRKHGFGYC